MPEHFLSNKPVYITPVCPNSRASLSSFLSHLCGDIADRAADHRDYSVFHSVFLSSKQEEKLYPRCDNDITGCAALNDYIKSKKEDGKLADKPCLRLHHIVLRNYTVFCYMAHIKLLVCVVA